MRLPSLPRLLGRVLLGVGFAGFLGGFILGGSAYIPVGMALPLVAIQSWQVDSSGHIYLALGFYSRVQQYDSHGRFLRGWPVPTEGGPISLATADPGEIAVYAQRPRRRFLYDTTGTPLGSMENEHFPEDNVDTRPWVAGGELELQRGLLWPQVLHRRPDGTQVALIQPSLPSWFFGAPVPVAGFALAGALLLSWSNDPKRRRPPTAAT